MEDALYLVHYVDVSGSGGIAGGVIVLETNRAFGGDSAFAYIGKFEIVHGAFDADVTIIRHSVPGGLTAWGDSIDRFKVTIHGRDLGDGILEGSMDRTGFPSLPIRLTFLERLP